MIAHTVLIPVLIGTLQRLPYAVERYHRRL